jgi:hypothetical protein
MCATGAERLAVVDEPRLLPQPRPKTKTDFVRDAWEEAEDEEKAQVERRALKLARLRARI